VTAQSGRSFEKGYRPAVSIRRGRRFLLTLGERPGVLRVELGGDHAIHFDAVGRIISVHKRGVIYRRTLDHRILARKRVDAAHRLRLDPLSDPLGFLAEQSAHARSVLKQLDDPALRVEWLEGGARLGSPRDWAREALRRAARFDRAALEVDHSALRSIYQPIPILPPDHYGSLILQLTEGCGWNRCGFCNFYRGIRYREKGTEEFDHHLEQVLSHLGGSLQRLHRVFLGQANALLIENSRLVPMLQRVSDRIPMLDAVMSPSARQRFKDEHPRWIEGFYSFIDGFHKSKSDRDYEELAGAGLRRVYLGLESGSDQVLRLLGKPATTDAAIDLVHSLHRASIRVGVIVLVGAGGKELADQHAEATLSALRRMELRRGDQLYLSKLVVHEGEAYQQRALREGIVPLSEPEQAQQMRLLRERWRSLPREPVPVAPYDITLTPRRALSQNTVSRADGRSIRANTT
jgi:hypothetical protein